MSPWARIETLLPLVLGLIVVAVQDIRSRRISNITNGWLALTGLVTWILAAGWGGAASSVSGLVIGLAIGVLAYKTRRK